MGGDPSPWEVAGPPAARPGRLPAYAGVTGRIPGSLATMSESFSEPAEHNTAESDVESNNDQVEPDTESGYVGRVAGDDQGYAGEQGAEARADTGAETGPDTE